MNWKQDKRVIVVYLVCIALVVLGIMSMFHGIIVLGFIIGIGTLVAAGCGAAGARWNSFKLLWIFMAGLVVLTLLAIISIIMNLITSGASVNYSLVVNIICIVIYVCGFISAFLLRGGNLGFSFRTLKEDRSQQNQQSKA
eukprot:TRINITY_DN316_c0_g1_i1.p1 TRINITY_DN316_c0_g1~~TRINITY_DN316_c0_g1_i1.p1  ORF type:complete len:140 (+),score=29.48 TRINITY_DN316_c0_g1_i1:96-515(+)